MGKITGFLEYERLEEAHETVEARKRHYREFHVRLSDADAGTQGARCMDCGIPFCQGGCPVNNIIPDWNDLVYRQDWKNAIRVLHSTNNFPEFTGRVCPAPCEEACVLGINSTPVTIKQVEKQIIDHAFKEGWVAPEVPEKRSGKKVAVIGSGPAGLACAQQLARAGHLVTVFERADRIGGLLRYGIPDFKLEKWIIDRRLEQLRDEGVSFQTGVHVGVDLSAAELRQGFDAVLLCLGSEQPRDLPVPGRERAGVHFAMDFLTQQNRRGAGDVLPEEQALLATGKHVVILGGGDTGSDCVGTSHRQLAKSVTSIELLERPPDTRHPSTPWPLLSSMTCLRASSIEVALVTSIATPSTRRPAALASASSVRSAATRRPVPITWWPRRARCRAACRPMPEVAPVTRMICCWLMVARASLQSASPACPPKSSP